MKSAIKLVSFADAAAFRTWLATNHASKTELWLRLKKAGVPGAGITYPEALDQALCFGWIDCVRKSVDDRSFVIRFSPRKKGSIWSKVNLQHYARLAQAELVAPAGRAVFENRDPARSGLYPFESRPKELPPEYRRQFEADPKAWKFFTGLAPSYQRTAIFWVLSAKQTATRERRLRQLIADSAAGLKIKPLRRP